jgi:hypothetical protein
MHNSYGLTQKKLVRWELFSSGVLNWFDLYYFRVHKTNDNISAANFFTFCHRTLQPINKNLGFDKNPKGLIVKLGSQRSNKFYRVYEKKTP